MNNKNNYKTGIGPVTDKLVEECIKKFTSEEIKNEIVSKLFDPILEDLSKKMEPYIYMISFLYSIILILIVVIIILMLSKK
jgi:hypothetical protein